MIEKIKNIIYNNKLIFIFLGIIMIYSFTASFEFAVDDKIYITENDNTKLGLEGIPHIWSNSSLHGFQGMESSSYRPLSMSVIIIEGTIWGYENATGYHLFNISLFALIVCISFLALIKLKIKNTLAFLSVTLFAITPINSEVISNIKNVDTLLMMLFGMLAILYYLKDNYIFVVLLFLALLSKETGVVFIPIIGLMSFIETRKINFKIIGLSIVPLFIFLTIRYAVIPDTFDSGFNSVANEILLFDSKIVQLLNLGYLQVHYLFQYIIPLKFIHYYSTSHFIFSQLTLAIGLVYFIGMIFIGYKVYKSRSRLFGFLFFLYLMPIVFLGSFLFPNGTIYADRFFLLPSLSISAVIVLGISKLYEKHNVFKYSVLVLPLYLGININECLDWKTEDAIAADLVENSNGSEKYFLQLTQENNWENRLKIISNYQGKSNYKLELKKAETLFHLNKISELYQSAQIIANSDIEDLTLMPYDIIYFYTLYCKNVLNLNSVTQMDLDNTLKYYPSSNSDFAVGMYLHKINKLQDAIEYYLSAIEKDTFLADIVKQTAYYNCGVCFMMNNEPEKGLEILNKGLEFGDNFELLYAIGKHHFFNKNYETSLEYIDKAFESSVGKLIGDQSVFEEAQNMKKDIEIILNK